MSFLQEYKLKMICMEEVQFMPIKDGIALRASLVDKGFHDFINKKSGAVLGATQGSNDINPSVANPSGKDQHQYGTGEVRRGCGSICKKILVQFPQGRESTYSPVQTSHEIKGEVLIKISDKTIPGLVLPDVVYDIKKKLGCIFVVNHNPESILLKQGQTIGLATSCVVAQKEQGQAPVECRDTRQSVIGRSNDTENPIGGTSGGSTEKAGQIAESIQSKKTEIFMKLKKRSVNLYVKVSS